MNHEGLQYSSDLNRSAMSIVVSSWKRGRPSNPTYHAHVTILKEAAVEVDFCQVD